MKNQKKLLQLPVDQCTQIPDAAVREEMWTWGRKEQHDDYIYSMSIIDNAGTQTLQTMIYDISGTPVLRSFLDDHKWITQIFPNKPNQKTILSEAEILSILYRSHWYPEKTNGWEMHGIYIAGAGTVEAAQAFFKVYRDKLPPLKRLDQYQEDQRKQVVRERNDRIRKSVDDMMLSIRPMPKDFERWVDEEALRNSRYIFYEYKHRAVMDGYCTFCHSEVKVRNPHHNTPGKCPHCGKCIVFKAQGIATEVYDDTNVAYLQKLPTGWVIRYFSVHKKYFGQEGQFRNPSLYIHEDAREFDTLEEGKLFEWDNFRQTGHYCFCERYGDKHRYGQYVLYTRNLRHVFENEHNARKYFPFSDFVKHARPVNPANLLIELIHKPQLEFLAKLKLYNLAEDFITYSAYNIEHKEINMQAKGIFSVLGVEKQELPVLQKLNPDLEELDLYKRARRSGIAAAVETVEWMRRNTDLTNNAFQRVLHFVPPHKAMRYLDEQSEQLIEKETESRWRCTQTRYHDMGDVCNTWKDYLDACLRLRYDLKNDFVLFPRHLSQAHDEAHKELEANKKAIQSRERAGIADMAAEYDRIYGWRTKHFLIRAPKDAQEITKEGQSLHHCVGSYVDKVARRETVILFIRRVEEPEKPFVTLEFLDGEVTQCYAHHDTQPPKEVSAFVAAWQRIKKPAETEIRIAIQAG